MANDGIIDALLSNIVFGGHCGITTRHARGSAARICSVAGAGGSSVRVETRDQSMRQSPPSTGTSRLPCKAKPEDRTYNNNSNNLMLSE